MRRTKVNLVAVLAAVTLTLSLFGASAFAESKSAVSKKEIKTLIAKAKTPAEHRQIAAYYREQAQRLNASAKAHAEMAESYAKHPVYAALEAKLGTSLGQGASHCRRWAQLDEEQAKEAEALSNLHEEMAKAAEAK